MTTPAWQFGGVHEPHAPVGHFHVFGDVILLVGLATDWAENFDVILAFFLGVILFGMEPSQEVVEKILRALLAPGSKHVGSLNQIPVAIHTFSQQSTSGGGGGVEIKQERQLSKKSLICLEGKPMISRWEYAVLLCSAHWRSSRNSLNSASDPWRAVLAELWHIIFTM